MGCCAKKSLTRRSCAAVPGRAPAGALGARREPWCRFMVTVAAVPPPPFPRALRVRVPYIVGTGAAARDVVNQARNQKGLPSRVEHAVEVGKALDEKLPHQPPAFGVERYRRQGRRRILRAHVGRERKPARRATTAAKGPCRVSSALPPDPPTPPPDPPNPNWSTLAPHTPWRGARAQGLALSPASARSSAFPPTGRCARTEPRADQTPARPDLRPPPARDGTAWGRQHAKLKAPAQRNAATASCARTLDGGGINGATEVRAGHRARARPRNVRASHGQARLHMVGKCRLRPRQHRVLAHMHQHAQGHGAELLANARARPRNTTPRRRM